MTDASEPDGTGEGESLEASIGALSKPGPLVPGPPCRCTSQQRHTRIAVGGWSNSLRPSWNTG